jgi:hypothetical protein
MIEWQIDSPDHELARSIRDQLHRFDAIDHQIEDHLLQLNLIGENYSRIR